MAFFEDDFGKVANALSTSSASNKRKLADTQTTMLKLENLDLDSDDEDILVLDTEGDPLLLAADIDEAGIEEGRHSQVRQSETGRGINTVLQPRNVGTEHTSNSDEEGKDKWLRCVVNDNGKLRCIVSASSETVSNSGETESLMADSIKELVKTYLTKRDSVIDESGILATPLYVVKKLAFEHGERLHCEGSVFPNGRHRIELFSGNMRGVGEGTSTKIARQMASIDLLEQVQLSGSGVHIPPVALLPGWLTNPDVFRDLFALCRQKNLPRIKMESKLNYDEESGPQPNCSKWRAVCTVGDLETVGESEEDIFARREAAREMYQMITNVEYKDLPFAIGRSCLTSGELSSAGFQPIMSNQKKIWLLNNRVVNNQLCLREDEEDLGKYNIEELKSDLSEADLAALEPSNPKKFKITITNNNLDLSKDDLLSEASPSMSRCVSEERVNNPEDSSWPWC